MHAGSRPIAIWLALAGAVAILLAIAAGSLVHMNRFADGAQWVNHTHEVIESLDAVLSDMTTAEASQRGYLLTGDESYLAPYTVSAKSLAERLERLKHLAEDNARQRVRIERLAALIALRFDLLETGIRARRAAADKFDLGRLHFAQGRIAMEDIRAMVAEMDAEENRLLVARVPTLETDRSQATLIIIVGNCVALFLLLATFTVVLRESRQRNEAQLRAHRYAAEVQDLYNNAPCGYHSLDANGLIVQINDTELAWLGYAREEVVRRKKLTDLLTPDSRARFHANFEKFKQDGVARDLEYDFVRKDGTSFSVSLSASLVRDAKGAYLMSRSTLFDITERKRAGQALREANVFLDSVLEHIPSTIFVKEAQELRYVRFNRAGERMLGRPRSEMLGKTDADVFAPDIAAQFRTQDRELLRSGTMLEAGEVTLETPAGERLVQTRKVVIAAEDGAPRYVLGIVEDITERRRSERKIRELNLALEKRAQQLEATNKELESFSYSVSHDLRSPLRAIDGFSRMLEEDHAKSLDDEGRRLLAVIRDNTARMSQLIDDLLAFSKLGRHRLAGIGVDMGALAREAWNQLSEIEGACKAQLIMGSLPEAFGDPVLLRQVWTNLLSNAIKYSSTRAQPVIEVSGWLHDGSRVYCVSDNGVGFDSRYSDKLFGVFQRLHRADEFPGTGVGLAIVKRVVVRHGGRVWAESILNQGAQLYFSLPEGHGDE